MQNEHDLENRRAAGIAFRREIGDQAIEGQIGMRVGAHGAFARLLQQRVEVHAIAELRTQYDGVKEVADQSFGFAARAAGNRGAHQNIFLAGIAVQQRGKGGFEQHEQRGLLFAAQRF